MNPDELERFTRRFRDRAAFIAHRPRPRIALPLINAARTCHEALAAAAEARRTLVAETQRRLPDPRDALTALNYLADSFGLAPFTPDDLDDDGED